MKEFSLDTIDDIISETIKLDEDIERRNIDKMTYSNPAAKRLQYLRVTKELLEEGHKVVKHTQGIKVNDKFIVGASLNKWRYDGKSKWYWYSKDSFKRVLLKSKEA